jgi:hypothetical protein
MRLRSAGTLLLGFGFVAISIGIAVARVKLHLLYGVRWAELLLALGMFVVMMALVGLVQIYTSLRTIWSRTGFTVNPSARAILVTVRTPIGVKERQVSIEGFASVRAKRGEVLLRKPDGLETSLGCPGREDAAVLASRISELTGLRLGVPLSASKGPAAVP